MSKSDQTSQMPTKEEEEPPLTLALNIDRSGVEASLADIRALLEEKKQKLAARERKRAQQSATPGTNPSAQAQAQAHGAANVNQPQTSGYRIPGHAMGPTRKLYATVTRMIKKGEDGEEITEEDNAELEEDVKQFIRTLTRTHPVLEVWDDTEEAMRVCR